MVPPQADISRPPYRTGSCYRPDIDGLRAIAILSVVFYHGGLLRISGGFAGVDIFFVISGYLIGGQIYSEIRDRSFSFANFYRRRARRILPAFFAVLAFVLIASLILLSPIDLSRLARSACAAAISASNILFWHSASYFDTRSDLNPLLMTWSLGVEEQFYAIIPLLLVVILRIGRKAILPVILLISTASFLFSWIALMSYPALVFYMLPARAWELGVGVALAVAQQSRPCDRVPSSMREWLSGGGLLLILAPLFLLNSNSSFPGPAALPSVLGTALLIAAPSNWINRRALSFAPLTFIGRVSYSWYLWHWPLLSLLHTLYGDAPPSPVVLAAIATSFVIAIASYYAIERPFRRSSRAAAPLLARYALATTIAFAVPAALWLTHGIPQRFPALAQIESQAARLKSDPCIADVGDEIPNLSAACIQRPASPQVAQVALWGDSHAAALAPAVRELTADQGYGFAEFAKASCPPAVGAAQYLPHHPSLAAKCLTYNQRVFDRLLHDSRVSVVIFAASWAGYLHRDWQHGWLVADPTRASTMPSDEMAHLTLSDSLSRTARALRSAGKQVYVFEDVPAFDFEPMWRLDSTSIPARRALVSLLGIGNAPDTGAATPGDVEMAGAASALLEQTLANQPSVTLINLRSSFCSAGALCPYRSGDQLLYADNNHLSPSGARYALRGFHLPPTSLVIAQQEPGP